ncbi:hypothetical protein DT383_06585 [Pseudomonas aeruginosa]|uniref:hypothetical protein n=1 Tax=Pseudomonas aeruginosa TaxID=287 RepID=UPI00077529CE|nr:hypothetical protein [Pseudomonas aeruginosa]KXG17007.1 hypothetical protein LT17_01594 [Pseudomonas aeruginosa]MCT5823267.1 hypothetical protein [Pseudomonas aeruginosa]RCI67561.1 hypothetical protein DT383_06585 [Pseudomonas aeruginosa]RTR71520.1 hypothetical protein DY930_21215 [Pseudomonas aeruginosa]HCL3266143.1 hypothetical protein [Pseudomonas aeruginosa]
MANDMLTVEEVLRHAEMLDRNLDAFDRTAPETVAALGGRDGLARMCEPTCVGPIPRIDADTWAAMSDEYEAGRANGSVNRGD